MIDDLREHPRGAAWLDDLPAAVRLAFADPDHPAHHGWEPLAACRPRVVGAVTSVLDVHHDRDVVHVGHGTAWTGGRRSGFPTSWRSPTR